MYSQATPYKLPGALDDFGLLENPTPGAIANLNMEQLMGTTAGAAGADAAEGEGLPNVPEPQLQNVVSTVNLSCTLNLMQIAAKARNAEYNPKRFAAVIMRIREPKTTALIFKSGKMVCTGAKSEADSRIAARKYAKIILKLGFPAKFLEFKVQNIVASCDVGFPVRLEGLACQHSDYSSYEPELFPGLIYRMLHPKVVILIFVSGKIVLTGAKERKQINEAFHNIYHVLQDFKKETPAPSLQQRQTTHTGK